MGDYAWGFVEGVASTCGFLFWMAVIDGIGQLIVAKINANRNQGGNNQPANQAAGGNLADAAV